MIYTQVIFNESLVKQYLIVKLYALYITPINNFIKEYLQNFIENFKFEVVRDIEFESINQHFCVINNQEKISCKKYK